MASIYTGIIYDNEPSQSSGSEETYKILWQKLYDTGVISKTIKDNIAKEEVGTPSDFLKVFYLSKLVRYLTLYQVDVNKNSCNPEYLINLKATYKLKCIRQTMFCKYGYDKIFDSVVSAITEPTGTGIGNMTISGRCNPFIVE